MNKITLLLCFILYGQGVFAQPANNECENATVLTVNPALACAGVTTANFSGATASGVGNTCSAATGPDIWFQFTAQATAHSVSLSNFTGTPQPIGLVLYEGDDCGNLTQLYCSFNNVINATALVPGTVYKVRAYFNIANPSLTTGFSVCVTTPAPPSNNNQNDCLITTVNFDFEVPSPPIGSTGPTFLNHNVVQGWRTTASDQMMEFWPSPNYENVLAYSGSQFIELNANLVSGVYQDYATPQPTVFSYGFAHRGRQGTDTCQLMAGPPGGPYTVVQTATTGTGAWSYNTGTYTVPAGQTTTRFLFQSVSSVGGSSVGNFLDAITFTANNGIISPNPFYMGCGTLAADVEAAGSGTWVAHSDNPTATTIANPDANTTTISGFGEQGFYYYDWVTEYCVSTLEISFTGDVVAEVDVENVEYCVGETAVPLTFTADPNNVVTWTSNGSMYTTPPTPDTDTPGTVIYYVVQTADSGCESIPVAQTVTVNPAVTPTTDFTYNGPVCSGTQNILPDTVPDFTPGGEFTATPAGLVIDPDTGEIDVTTSTPGIYTITYTVEADIATCTTEGSSSNDITINPSPPVADVAVVHPTCGVPTGTITVDTPVGTDYTYSINGTNYQAGNVFSSLAPGDYTIYVQNTEGCTSVSDPVTVNPALVVPSAPVVSAVQPTCTVATGNITVTSPTGTDYTYSIDGTNFQPGNVFVGQAPGTYTVMVQSTDGCTATSAITINPQPATPAVADVTIVQPICGVPTGNITVDTPVGTDYTYSINGTNYQAGNVFSSLAPGDYTIYVQNTEGCTSVSDPVTVNPALVVPSAPVLSAVQPTCSDATGDITVTSPTGTDFTYSIDGTNYQTSTVFANQVPGTYTITVQNTDGCTATSTITINQQPPTPVVANVSVTQPECTIPSGTLTIISPSGPGITYSIDGVNFQPSGVFTGLPQGNYNITVQNSFGCTSVTPNYTIDAPPAPAPSPTLSASQPTCTSPVGTILVSAPLGTGYTYSIDGSNFQSGTTFPNLPPGTYTILAKSIDGCTAGSSINIYPVPDAPSTPNITVTQPDCAVPSGTVTVNSPVGSGLTYSINGTNFQVSPVFSNLASGSYTVTVKNTAGCISTAAITVNTAPAVPQVPVITAVQPTCDVATGTITVTSPTGGGLTYSIDGITYQPGTTFTGLGQGTYTVTVQNSVGCTRVSLPLTINTAPDIPAVPNLDIEDTDCDAAFGIATVNAPVGSGYMYSLNDIYYQSNAFFNNLSPGDYTLYVRNSFGCKSSVTFTISAPPLVSDAGSISGAAQLCNGSTVEMTATVPDGIWAVSNEDLATISETGELTGVAPGNVIVSYTVEEPGKCPATVQQIVWVVGLPNIEMEDIYICRDNETGDYSTGILDTGLSAGYTFEWAMNGTELAETSGTLVVDEPGNYTVTITNIATGCVGEASATVLVSSPAIATAEVGADFNLMQSITVYVAGGSGDYEYQLEDGPFQDSPVFNGIQEGEYTITIRDKNGCGDIQITVFALNFPRFFSPNGDGENDTWNIEGLIDQPTARIYVFDRYGKLVASVMPSGTGWDGTFNGANLPATDYWFRVYYESFDGSEKEFKAHFSLIR